MEDIFLGARPQASQTEPFVARGCELRVSTRGGRVCSFLTHFPTGSFSQGASALLLQGSRSWGGCLGCGGMGWGGGVVLSQEEAQPDAPVCELNQLCYVVTVDQ